MADKHFPNGLPRGKMKTLFGLYKILGRELFLALAEYYCPDVKPTVEATVSVMEGTWYNESKEITQADKMVYDYNEHEGVFDPRNHTSRSTGTVKSEIELTDT